MPRYSFEDILYPGWEVTGKLGSGSFGTVYAIEREKFGHRESAALKVISIPQNDDDIEKLREEYADEGSITARFKNVLEDVVREYSLMADLRDCSNIVHCYDIDYKQHNDGIGWDVFIRMELLTPLKKALGKENASEAQVVKIGRDICSALMYCEKKNVVHRDIKPENILIARDGTCKLGDFGEAKIVEHSTKGSRKGTAQYMSPEVWYGNLSGKRADIYSLGLVLYWLLNEKRTPFLKLPPHIPTIPEEEAAERRRFQKEIIPAPAHGSRELQAIVLKACAYEPEERYENAAEMLRDLSRLNCGEAAFDLSFLDDIQGNDTSPETDGTYGGTYVEATPTIGVYDSPEKKEKKKEEKAGLKFQIGFWSWIVALPLSVAFYYNHHFGTLVTSLVVLLAPGVRIAFNKGKSGDSKYIVVAYFEMFSEYVLSLIPMIFLCGFIGFNELPGSIFMTSGTLLLPYVIKRFWKKNHPQ